MDHVVPEKLDAASRIALTEAIDLQEGEEVLIVTNPDDPVELIARSLYRCALDLGAHAVLTLQPAKGPLDFTERAIVAAIVTLPDVLISISANKIGKDRHGLRFGYLGRDGRVFDHIYQWAIRGERRSRGFWSPGVRIDTWLRAIDIDYEQLRTRAGRLGEMLNQAETIRITSPAGTDVTIGIKGRRAMVNDGDFRRPGRGGNLPAGEAFISPAVGQTNGVIALDGTISSADGNDFIPSQPVIVHFEDGFVTSIEADPGGSEAVKRLTAQIEASAERARAMGQPDLARNAKHLGEVGFGLNEKATLIGDLLEDEKLPGSCHFAIGSNYDEDAKALSHFDCVVLNPTVYLDGKEISY